MNMSDLPQLEGDIIAPNYSKPVLESVSRWSSTGIVERPALTMIPYTEEDIIKAIEYATKHDLQLLPVGGGHGFLAPITSKTLYLDLKKFNMVEVDSDNHKVNVGGGAVTAELIKACTECGFYTTWPNSNAVGVVGCILGGGNVSRLSNPDQSPRNIFLI
jgi:FAD/FMN-containing dehydrogenase